MKILRKIQAVFIVVCLFLSLMGCTSVPESEENPTILILLMGKHANSIMFDAPLDSKITDVYSSYGNICIVAVDGEPEIVRKDDGERAGCYDEEYLIGSKKKRSSEEIWKREKLNVQIAEIKEYIEKMDANDPEVDTFKALQIAAKEFGSIQTSMGEMGKNVQKEIIIYDTGFCTKGVLDFQNDDYLELIRNNKKLEDDKIKNKNVKKFIDDLEQKAELPNLTDVKISWYGLGQVDTPQKKLNSLEILNLQYVWGEILKMTNAIPSKEENSDERYGIFNYAAEKGVYTNDQPVTPIKWQDNYIEEETEEIGRIEFLPNEAKYRQIGRAMKTLDKCFKKYSTCLNAKMRVIGTTSSWRGGSVSLSEQRAKKVRNDLLEMGIPEDKIETEGYGYNLSYCKNDVPNGKFIESIAAKNRSAHIYIMY